MHDLVIRGATIVDGMRAPARPGVLAVDGDRIVAVGEDVGRGREEVDAAGLVLAPGTIDSHTHFDAQITWDPGVAPSPAHGVTTVVIGNCGFTIAPCRPADRELVMRNLTHVEGMSLEVLRHGVVWDFESVPEYLDLLARSGSVPNVAALVGHSALRTWVMGAAATERAASDDEVVAMARLLEEAMAAGAAGFATSTAPQHNGEGGVPMPSRLAADAE